MKFENAITKVVFNDDEKDISADMLNIFNDILREMDSNNQSMVVINDLIFTYEDIEHIFGVIENCRLS